MADHVHRVALWYPRLDDSERSDKEPTAVRISLVDVRAADDIVIDYDFERDGYRIRMPTVHEWGSVEEMEKVGEGLVEVAFAPAWVNASGPNDSEASQDTDAAARAAYKAAIAFRWSKGPFMGDTHAIAWEDMGEENRQWWREIAKGALSASPGTPKPT